MATPNVHKLLLKTDAADRRELINYCIDQCVLGLGWGPKYLDIGEPSSFDEYYEAAEATWSRGELRSVRAFHEAATGSLVWFRDLTGNYYLAKLISEWRPLIGPVADRLDLGNVRDVQILTVGSEANVPGGVLRAYAAPRQQTFCNVKDPGARAYSRLIGSERLGTDAPDLDLSAADVLTSLLSPADVEDLVATYLQDVCGYVLLRARQSRSTAVYEYALRHPSDGHIAVVQVKTGHQSVPIETLDSNTADRWYVYTDAPQELPHFVTRIERKDLLAYMSGHAQSLPPVVETWMRRVRGA